MSKDRTAPPHRSRLAKTAHFGLDRILQHQGFSAEATESLLDFDAEMFRWRSLQAKAEFTAVLLREMEVDLDHGVFLGLLSVSRLAYGIDGETPRPPTIGEVADAMRLDPSRASRIVSELVEKGFLRREADQSDGRRIVLTITLKGMKVIDDFRTAKWRAMSTLFNGWTDGEIANFAQLIRKYLDGLETMSAQPSTIRS